MGILRLYLALCVVAAHGSGQVLPWAMHDSNEAVQTFYIISGFYMAMVLSTRYSSPRDFYLSRFLRIFPTYWIVLALTFVLSIGSGLIFNRWLMLRIYASHPFAHNGVLGVALATLFNFTLIGQDWIMFLKHDAGQSLHFTSEFWNDPRPLYWYLLIPQAWTIGLELTFYAIAPFLNRLSNKWLVGVALSAFVARLISYQYLGMDHDPWDYRFFLLEIGLFLFGMLAYRLYAQMSSHPAFQRWQGASPLWYVAGAAALLMLMNLHLHAVQLLGLVTGPHIAGLIASPVFIVGIPILFLAFGNNRFDRLVGELSYPVYLIHMLVLVVMANALAFRPGAALARITALVSIAFATVLYAVFIAPLDRKRHDLSIKDGQIRSAEEPPESNLAPPPN
jgi:peptidoglycan/LPS O-acetylase OafA/YrhL